MVQKEWFNQRITFDFFAKVASYSILISVFYGVISLYVYYKLLFQVPIFQYVGLSEIVLFAPSAVIGYLFSYLLCVGCYLLLVKSHGKHNRYSFFIWFLLFLAYVVFITLIARNSISSKLGYQMILQLLLLFPIIIGLTFINLLDNWRQYSNAKYLFIPILVVFYLSTAESIVNYFAITQYNNEFVVKLKFKNNHIIQTSEEFKYIGRTEKFWFFYLKVNRGVRVINNDEVLLAEFYGTAPTPSPPYGGGLPPTTLP